MASSSSLAPAGVLWLWLWAGASLPALATPGDVAPGTVLKGCCEALLFEGKVRLQALSPTLFRLEQKGATGFEDRKTFAVVNRDFPGVPIQSVKPEPGVGVRVATAHYDVVLQANVGGGYWNVQDKSGKGVASGSNDGMNRCPPIQDGSTGRQRVRGRSSWSPETKDSLLNWPAPLESTSYHFLDSPRFVPPVWGPTPQRKGAEIPDELVETSGFDFSNPSTYDAYVFLLGSSLDSWSASRVEFLKLAGPTPLIPDYAYGTWFTRWYNYSEAEARAEVEQWATLKLPLDVWALDMNWRNTSAEIDNTKGGSGGSSDGEDWFYDRPNDRLFPDFKKWFEYLRSKGLRTYFNDHPYPVAARGAGGLQTSPEEVSFRWEGLTRWLEQGLTFWWFDRNWMFSIPPPMVNTSQTGATWMDLSNAAWGSYIYYEVAKKFHESKNDTWYGRPMALTKFAQGDWRGPGIPAQLHAEHPAQHRYPVWWTGDGVPLMQSVESMVDAGLYDMKPFVHSDCGGDYRGSGTSLLRWTAHCTFSPILRYHGSDHRPWTYDAHVVDTVRSYLQLRYRLAPSLIAGGQRATRTGVPLAARGDFYWPDHRDPDEAANSYQYVFLEDFLVAPIGEDALEALLDVTAPTSRRVWIPPGCWEDVWNGTIVHGPKHVAATQPPEFQPMWYRCDGGMMVMVPEPKERIQDQDWSTLTVEAFPAAGAHTTKRTLYERGTGHSTELLFTSNDTGAFKLQISEAEEGASRAWTLRLHLRPKQQVAEAFIDGAAATPTLLQPTDGSIFTLGTPGAPPAQYAGPIAELHLPRSSKGRSVVVRTHSVDLIFA